MKLQNKTKQPPKQSPNHCCFKKNQHFHQLYSNKTHNEVCAMCVFSVSWRRAPLPMTWQRCPGAAGPSSCWVWRLAQLHIIRRPWMEDSKVWRAAGRTRIITGDWPARRFTLYPTCLRDPDSPEQGAPCWSFQAVRCLVPRPGDRLRAHPRREGSYVLIICVAGPTL